MKILSNQRRCNLCGDEPFSAHVHDSRHCKCGNVMVDGGMSYCRHNCRGEDMSIVVSNEHYDLLMETISDPTRNHLGHLCNVVRVLRDHMGVNLSDVYEEDKS